MDVKSNRLVIIPVITLIVLSVVFAPVSAKTVVTRTMVRGAWGYWMIEIPSGSGDWYSISINVWQSEESITLSIDTFVNGVLDEEYDEELDPSEFIWTPVYCRVSTEIEGDTTDYSLTVEWDVSSLLIPPHKSHSNEVGDDDIRRIRNDLWREDPNAPDYSTIITDLPPFPHEVTIQGHGEVGKSTQISIEKLP